MKERLSGHGLDSRQIAYDTAVALGMTAISVTILVSLTRRAAPWALGTATPLMVLHSACLIGRRTWPVPVVALQIATGLGVAAVGVPPEVLGVAILIGVYTVGAYRPVRVSLPTLGAAELAMIVAQWLSRADPDASTIVGNAIVMASAWFLGNSVYSRRVYAEQLERKRADLTALLRDALGVHRTLDDRHDPVRPRGVVADDRIAAILGFAKHERGFVAEVPRPAGVVDAHADSILDPRRATAERVAE